MRALVFGSTLIWSVTATGQSHLAQNISVKDNPRFLPHFLERFSEGFRAATQFQPEMPPTLRDYWLENMREPRDFSEEILPGLSWPRFQWGIEADLMTRPARVRPVYQWFDLKNPDRLSSRWNKAFCLEHETSWIGVSWTGDLERVEYFSKTATGLKVRRYLNRKFAFEYAVKIERENGDAILKAEHANVTLYTQMPVGRSATPLKDPRAAHLQFNVQREFLINPRNYARAGDGRWERVFFP